MAESKYRIIITNENGVIAGRFERFVSEASCFNIDFDPATILCDLPETVDYERHSDNESENYFLNANYSEHPFFAIGLPEDILYSRSQSQLHFSWFYDFIVELKELCEQSRNISLSQFEVFKQYFDVRFTYKIEFQEVNPFYNEYEMDAMNGGLYPECEFIYRGLEENRDFTMTEMLDFHGGTPFRHNYSCHSLADIICAVWHYLILHEYKFRKCNHCGKYFATRTLKKQYCDRKSPYPAFEQHNCEQAVRNIKQKLARRKKSAYTYLSNYYSGGVDLFLDKCAVLKDAVDRCSSAENLRALEAFLNKESVREEWYKVEYK